MIFFTSDQHFGHTNIIEYSKRPFRDVEHMNEELVARHNSIVQDGDIVYHLGDFALNERLVLPFLKRLKGRHHLIPGNHDRCHPCHKKSKRATRDYLLWGFETVAAEVQLGPYTLCHLPYAGDRTETERYSQFRPKDRGGWLLHGHVHEVWGIKGRMLNVGVDQHNFTPISMEAVDRITACSMYPILPDVDLDQIP